MYTYEKNSGEANEGIRQYNRSPSWTAYNEFRFNFIVDLICATQTYVNMKSLFIIYNFFCKFLTYLKQC